MLVSIGRLNSHGGYGPNETSTDEQEVWKAYNRPYVKFSLDDLWAGL